MFHILLLFCILSFLAYGIGCLTGSHMVREFERYGLPRFRMLTGFLQIIGAVGLLFGLRVPVIGALAAGGLTILMLLGFGVRLKIRDCFFLSIPSFLYMVLNAWLCSKFVSGMIR